MNAERNTNIILFITRVILGVVVLAHGAQKLLGWFGGYGFEGTMGFFTNTIGVPYFFALLIIIAETVGMIFLITGFLSRFLAAAVILIMVGAIITVHSQFGFFMDWGNTLGGEGYEFHILAIGLALPTLVLGSGAYSIDYWVAQKVKPFQKKEMYA